MGPSEASQKSSGRTSRRQKTALRGWGIPLGSYCPLLTSGAAAIWTAAPSSRTARPQGGQTWRA